MTQIESFCFQPPPSLTGELAKRREQVENIEGVIACIRTAARLALEHPRFHAEIEAATARFLKDQTPGTSTVEQRLMFSAKLAKICFAT